MPNDVTSSAEVDLRYRKAVYFHLLLWIALVGLTGLSLGLAFVHLGPFNLAVALAIATTQIALLGLFFMSLRSASSLILVTAGAAFVFLLSMFVLTLNDLFSRV